MSILRIVWYMHDIVFSFFSYFLGVFGIKAINVKCARVWFTNAAIKVLLLNVQAPKRMVVKRLVVHKYYNDD